MLPSRRPFLADEELGKKDDDHRVRPSHTQQWRPKQWKPPRPRRLLLGLVALYLLYLFFKNMPTDLPPAPERFNPAFAQARQAALQLQQQQQLPSLADTQQGPPDRVKSNTELNNDHYYDGKINFYSLAKSLHRFQGQSSRYGKPTNHVVIFAAASLKSVSDLLPLACQMATRKVNEVHFVLMGREDVSIEGIQRVNGLDDASCPVNWHDARPDYAQWSTDARMERAVVAGLGYVRAFLHPRVVLTQGESWEDPFLWRGVRGGAHEMGISHVALPSAARDIMWMSTLDSSALQAWNNVQVEILIHAPSESSGSLIRLIRTLLNADYLGRTPSLTIELPPHVDPELLRFLQSMEWPSHASGKVTLRRRIQPHGMDSTESSLKTVEAFYPRDPTLSHVLVLSPQTELAPSFYHYLTYTMLRFKHSARAKQLSTKLIGISLELPSTLLTDNEPLTPPELDNDQMSNLGDGESLPLFLWQAPNSNAALYFGDKWAEFHEFLSNRFTILGGADQAPLQEKLISKKYPAVVEFLLEFIRGTGYYMIYPAFPAKGTFTLATVHNELYQIPEEFAEDGSPDFPEPSPEVIDDPSKPLTPDSAEGLGFVEKPLSRASTVMPLLERFSLNLPRIDYLPLLSYGGEKLSGSMYARGLEDYRNWFRARYGGCSGESSGSQTVVGGLFCLDN
ncbi:uncharacterized protein BO80DRAFT_425322 [Aspergillus ibericus CBS 121593]|uniref:Glycosyltransferase 2 n=1 Tax=Aspergillus ibericus CBS 121593 TaxID=1448316 RepID=A0A395GZB0_9EURO|nr:hypothetical protein BO80DRAFT_425322 [Aspergillus ibericus CBS 121593]RAL00927.1 hypothetical protein BO80DRAFT_425322 [Aspergillus ibericus CBS 121593]